MMAPCSSVRWVFITWVTTPVKTPQTPRFCKSTPSKSRVSSQIQVCVYQALNAGSSCGGGGGG